MESLDPTIFSALMQRFIRNGDKKISECVLVTVIALTVEGMVAKYY